MSGYYHCHCRDCFEIIVGEPGDYCSDCNEHGCPDYQGVKGMPQECKNPNAYGEENVLQEMSKSAGCNHNL
jgi:hypothetical protein